MKYTFDPITVVLLVLASIFALPQLLFPHTIPQSFETGTSFFMGLLCIYNGLKNMRKARERNKKVYWYQQPFILLGIALLFGIPLFIVEDVLTPLFPGTASILSIAENIIFAAFVILCLAAAYFFVRSIIRAMRFENQD